MIKKLKDILRTKTISKPTTDFSDFFHSASSAEKKKLLKSVIKKANKDQLDLVQRYKTLKTNNGLK